MAAPRHVLVLAFALAHGVLMPWHLAAAHHTSAAHLLDVHVVLEPPAPGGTDAEHCHGSDAEHEESDHHHTPLHETGHALEHAGDYVPVRAAAPPSSCDAILALEPSTTGATTAVCSVAVPRDPTTFPLGPPGPSPIQARAPPRA